MVCRIVMESSLASAIAALTAAGLVVRNSQVFGPRVFVWGEATSAQVTTIRGLPNVVGVTTVGS